MTTGYMMKEFLEMEHQRTKLMFQLDRNCPWLLYENLHAT